MFLAYASHKSFILYQMNVKSAFLNGFLDEEVFVQQPPRFINQTYPNHVYRLTKILYSLKHPLELGMVDLVLFFFQMILLGVKIILLSLLKRRVMIFY
jgi:Reverse transcriptase (RNA-dependent DNA polymerase)